MQKMTRRELLSWFAVAPTLPRFFVQSAQAMTSQAAGGYDGPIVVVVRMQGGNDGLNTLVPFRDDRYFKARPTIGIPAAQVLKLSDDLGLHPALADVRRLIDDGVVGIVQGVGYAGVANATRSHLRATEIWETGATDAELPSRGWLGRYLDHDCESTHGPLVGVQFADVLGQTLKSDSGRSTPIGNPDLLAAAAPAAGPASAKQQEAIKSLDYLRQVQNQLSEVCRQVQSAGKGSGSLMDYPDTPFGQSLRWTADMIETGAATRLFYATLGSFDTHSDQAQRHERLFKEFGRGLRSFATQMRKTGHLNRIFLVTFSDFGRQMTENRDAGTDHADASLLFTLGGKVQAGLLGRTIDLESVRDGGFAPVIDFRQVYANLLTDWLKVDAGRILGQPIEPYRVVAAT